MTAVLREPQDERFQVPFVVRLSNHSVSKMGFQHPARLLREYDDE
jgi:hypothetical protein